MNVKDTLGRLILGSKYKKETSSPKENIQDLLDYEEITDKGIVVANGTYFGLVEVGQLNSNLLDVTESSSVWLNFRILLNSLNIRYSTILQSQFYDVKDFVSDYETNSKNLTNLTPELIEAREFVVHNYLEFSEQRVREQRAYMMFRFNPSKEGLEMGLSTGSAKIDELFTQMKSSVQNNNEEEKRSVAISTLDEVCDLVYHLLYSIGCNSVRLNRDGVIEYMYNVINRDLAIHQRYFDANMYGMFNHTRVSLTADIIVDTLDVITKEDELYQTYYEYNEIEYKDDELYKETLGANLNNKPPSSAIETSVIEVYEKGFPHEVIANEELNEKHTIHVGNEQFEKTETDKAAFLSVEKVVDFKSYSENSGNDLSAAERKRLRRAEARKRKKERIRSEKEETSATKDIQALSKNNG